MTINDIFYAASLVEFTARKTMNTRHDVVQKIGRGGLSHIIEYADVNHCLSLKQVSDEIIEDFNIGNGTVDTVTTCKYNVPSPTDIGKVYARLVEDVEPDLSKWPDTLYDIFKSPFSDQISDFNSSLYFAPRGEVAYYYRLEMASNVT